MKKIMLANNKGIALVDDNDYERVSAHKWHLLRGYASAKINGHGVLMHRFVMDTNGKEIVDHANRNKLDNRKINLRFADRWQSATNRIQDISNTGYRGVEKKWSNFRAVITSHGKRYRIGTFSTAEEAATAYNDKAKELHGEFAVLNKV